jgi:putative restriction endonuclease
MMGGVVGDLDDRLVRTAAFAFLEDLRGRHGDSLPWAQLTHGFRYAGRTIPLVGARGIWKPRVLDLPISVTTSHADPYGDELGDDGFLRYRYFGRDANHPDNAGLRRAMIEGHPLIYFAGTAKGVYTALWPAIIVGDDPATRTFTIACEDPQVLRPGLPSSAVDEVRRAYVTRLAVQRLHQAAFRQRVLRAYRTSCSVCRLQRHPELLDAAHILPDRHDRGDPVVPNGVSLCKIHHAAFDSDIIGIRPDYVVEVRRDVLDESDGPMLRHGLQEAHGARLLVPRSPTDRPDRERLEERYELFRRSA